MTENRLPSDPTTIRALWINHPTLAFEAAMRRVADMEAEIEALRATVRDCEPHMSAYYSRWWHKRHAATIRRALDARASSTADRDAEAV